MISFGRCIVHFRADQAKLGYSRPCDTFALQKLAGGIEFFLSDENH